VKGVPSVQEGREDRWQIPPAGAVWITEPHPGAATGFTHETVMPCELRSRVLDVMRGPFGVAMLTVRWAYPRPLMWSALTGDPVPVYLVDELCTWYAGQLHKAAQRP
jgi:hypothetical protein